MDGTTEPHDLLLALAGRVDDDLLAWARELVAVGEDARAVEMLTATLVADRTPLPGHVRNALIDAGRSVRIDLDATALAPPRPDEGVQHRFDRSAPMADEVVAAIRGLPPRYLQGGQVLLTWRLTPAGSAPGPLPHPVVLVRPDSDEHPSDVLAYQLAVALDRAGVQAAVEVLTGGRPVSEYHSAALRHAVPIRTGDATAQDPPGEAPGPAPSDRPGTPFSGRQHGGRPFASTDERAVDLHRPSEARRPGPHPGPVPFTDAPSTAPPLPRRDAEFDPTSQAEADLRPDHDPGRATVEVDLSAASLPPPRPVRQVSGLGGRRWSADGGGDSAPPPGSRPVPNLTALPRRTSVTPISRAANPIPLGRRAGRPLEPVSDLAANGDHSSDGSLFTPTADPPPDALNERPGHEDHGLGGPGRDRTAPDGGEGPERDNWSNDWTTGSWAMSSSLLGPAPGAPGGPTASVPATEARPIEARPIEARPIEARPVEARPVESRPDVVAVSPPPAPRRTARHRFIGDTDGDDEPTGPESAPVPQATAGHDSAAHPEPDRTADPSLEPADQPGPGLGLRPESVARLSDDDRELLARLQAELAEGQRPRGAGGPFEASNGVPHPNGSPPSHPNGSRPNGSHPNGSHPNGAHPHDLRPTDGTRGPDEPPDLAG